MRLKMTERLSDAASINFVLFWTNDFLKPRKPMFMYVIKRSQTHHLYSSDFIQRNPLNAEHFTSHFGKCSGSLAGPEIRGNCSEVSFHILNFEAILSKIVWFRQGNMWPRKEFRDMFWHFHMADSFWLVDKKASNQSYFYSPKTNYVSSHNQMLDKNQCPDFLNPHFWHFCRLNSEKKPHILQRYISWCICKHCLAFEMGLDWGWELLNSWSSDSLQLQPISA